MTVTVSGIYSGRDRVLTAIDQLRRAGVDKLEVMSPVPDQALLQATAHRPSRVGFITLFGGIFGMLLGFIGASLTHLHWGLITGGKPIVSVPPFVVVAFEMTILFGGLSTLIGVILLSRLPRLKPDEHYDPRVSEDHYVLLIQAAEERLDQVLEILRSTGAEVRS